MRIRLYVVVLALILTWTCWDLDAFKVTKSSKKNKLQQKKQNKPNQLFNSAKEKWNNQLGQPLSLECDAKNGEGIFQVRSEFHPNEKDRQYRWKCHTVATEPMTDCTWSNEVNDFQGSLLYMCPSNFVITGISSTYNRKQQDRKWKIKCCRANNHFTRACKISETINRFGKPFFYTAKDECSDPGVMTGLASEINREKLKDREWKVLQCSYANQRSCKYKCNSIRSRISRKGKHKHKGQKRKVHKEENSIVKSKLEHKNVEETSENTRQHHHHNHHSHHHSNHAAKVNNHHHTKHHKKRRNKVEANNAKSEKHHTHKSHHKHRPHHRHHHYHDYVSTVNTVEAKPQVPTQQPTKKPSSAIDLSSIISGIPRSLNKNTYYSILHENNPLPMPLLKQNPMQLQQRPLSRSSIINFLESSLPLPPTSPMSQPLNSPQPFLPLRPVYWDQPNNIPIENDPVLNQPYPHIYDSRLSPLTTLRQTPFQILQDLTLPSRNSDFDNIHSHIKLPLMHSEHYWVSALYQIQDLLNWLPVDDRSDLRKSLRVIIERHLEEQVPSISISNPLRTNVPEKEPLNVHIHLPRSDNKHTDTPSGPMNDKNIMQKIKDILSKLPTNSEEVHFDFPGSKKDEMTLSSHNDQESSKKQLHYLLDNDYSIRPKLASELENTELLRRMYS